MDISELQRPRKVVAFDHLSDTFRTDWIKTFRQLRETAPIAWTEAHGGYWVVSSYELVTRIARDWETFSSAKHYDPVTHTATGGLTIPTFPAPASIPIETDPPVWNVYRDLLNPFFGPKAVEARRQKGEQMASALIDRVIERGAFDIVLDLANPLPALMTLDLLGIETDDWHRWAEPFHELVYIEKTAKEFLKVLDDLNWIRAQLAKEIVANRAKPKPGLFSAVCNGQIGGKPIPEADLVEIGMMVLVGGVDTTTALTANTLMYLHKNRAARKHLIDNPDAWPVAREELIRFFTPVHNIVRHATKDVEVGGQLISKGDRILIAYSGANHDTAAFEHPDDIVLGRMPNKHVGFGNGIHRCLGSFVARLMWDVMVKEVLNRVPDYEVIEAEAVQYPLVSSINGWIKIPATFTPGKKVGAGLQL